MAINLLALAHEVLPRNLREDFERSLGTPQFGPHHNEGLFMDSHLRLVLAAIEGVRRGEFHKEVPVGVRILMSQAAEQFERFVSIYVLLHDLDKINCLTFVHTDGRKIPVSYEEWQEMLRDDPDGPAILERNDEALRSFCERRNIRQISYYQNCGGRDRTHGKVTARRLRSWYDIPPIVIQAIKTHEVAYLFKDRGGLNLPLFARTFGHSLDIEEGFALLVNYADQMGSWQLDGQPDIASFVALAKTCLAIPKFWEIHRQVSGQTAQFDLSSQGRREKLFRELWRSLTLLETESVDEAVRRIITNCTSSPG